MIIAIDSQILIYAEIVPRKNAKHSPEFNDLRVRAKLLLAKVDPKKDTIILPVIAVSELLVPVPQIHRGAVIAVLQQKFVCPPFDLPAASIAAELTAQHSKLPQTEVRRPADSASRHHDRCVCQSGRGNGILQP